MCYHLDELKFGTSSNRRATNVVTKFGGISFYNLGDMAILTYPHREEISYIPISTP